MHISIGKHEGKSVGNVVVKEPGYTKWVLAQPNVNGELLKMKTEMDRLVQIFDCKKIIRKCDGNDCSKPAVKYTAYANNPSSLNVWCDTCDPYQAGAIRGKLTELKTYKDALDYVDMSCNATKAIYKTIISEMAAAKGLKKRSSNDEIDRFLS